MDLEEQLINVRLTQINALDDALAMVQSLSITMPKCGVLVDLDELQNAIKEKLEELRTA